MKIRDRPNDTVRATWMHVRFESANSNVSAAKPARFMTLGNASLSFPLKFWARQIEAQSKSFIAFKCHEETSASNPA